MTWPVVVLIAVGVVVVIAVAVSGSTDESPVAPDPLFVVGIPICGASAALLAAVGPAALLMTLAGLVCIAVGVHRMRTVDR